MPQIPILIPVIVAGVTVGSVIKSKTLKISKRRLLSASVVAGLLNAVYAYVVYSYSPQPTSFRGVSSVAPTSWIAFVAGSFLTGFLIVLAVLGIARTYGRVRKGEELEELPEPAPEGEPTLTPS